MVGGLRLVDDQGADGFCAAVEGGDIVDTLRRLVGRVGGLIASKDGEVLGHRLEQLRVRGVVPISGKKERLLPSLGLFHDE